MYKTMKAVCFAAAFLLLAASADAALVASYTFTGNANDTSGNGNHGSVFGASLTTDRFGNPDMAFRFDGDDDYIDVAHADSLDITDGITISLWTKMDAAGSPIGLNQYWVSKGTGGPHYEDSPQNTFTFFLANYTTAPDMVQCYLSDGSTLHGILPPEQAPGLHLANLDPDTWYHFAVTWDGDLMKVYKNGIPVPGAEQSFSGSINSLTADLDIGRLGNGTRYFDGVIDDLLIYNRALSELEIQQIYDAPNPVPAPASILLFSSGLLGIFGTRRKLNKWQQ